MSTSRPTILIAAGVLLVSVAYLGLPAAIDALVKWQLHQEQLERKPRFSKIASPAPGTLQPGLGFFQDIDEVRLLYLRSFHDEIEIRIRRPYLRPNAPAELHAVVTRSTRTEQKIMRTVEKKVSDEVFDEVRQYVLRQDLIYASVSGGRIGLDGATWYLEGRKGDFVIRHIRWSPSNDSEFLAIGKRMLTLAEIELRDEDFY